MFRITHAASHARRVRQMNSALTGLSVVERQLSSGKRFTTPGEAPEAAARVLRIERKMSDLRTYDENIQTGRSMLARAETAVVSLSDVVDAARSLALQMADSFYDGDRADQVPYATGLVDAAMDLLNTSFDDIYLFGGHQSSAPPYSLDVGGQPVYAGDSGGMELDVSDGARAQVNIDPAQEFNGGGGTREDIMQLLVDLRDALAADNQGAIGAMTDRFQDAIADLSETVSSLGSRYKKLEVHASINEMQDLELERLRSSIEDTNYAEAASELSLRQTAYQASLASTAQVQGLSLLNYMR